jgi:IS30 family transposase
MADYPKKRKTRTTVKMSDGKWERTTNIPGLPHTIKYTRWYGNYKVDLYHKKGDNRYTLVRMGRGDDWSAREYHVTSLQRAQKLVDLMMTSPRRSG